MVLSFLLGSYLYALCPYINSNFSSVDIELVEPSCYWLIFFEGNLWGFPFRALTSVQNIMSALVISSIVIGQFARRLCDMSLLKSEILGYQQYSVVFLSLLKSEILGYQQYSVVFLSLLKSEILGYQQYSVVF